MTPKRIPADPRVAMAAWEVPSETRLDLVHHVAIRVGDISVTDECPNKLRGTHEARVGGAGRALCWACRGLLWWWECDCPDSTFRDRMCKHALACKAEWRPTDEPRV